MSSDFEQIDPVNIENAIKGLMDDLAKCSVSSEDAEDTAASNSLDLMVDRVLHGIDIRKHFPTFYQKLLQNINLRRQFIDLLSLCSAAMPSPRDPYLINARLDLSFLKKKTLKDAGWPVSLSQPRVELMNIFFPAQASYRAAEDLGITPVYTLLRKDFTLGEIIYSVLINGTLAEQDQSLNANLNLAVSDDASAVAFPIRAALRWGDYAADFSLLQAGKQTLPDIPLSQIFNEDLTEVKGDLYLTLSSGTR